MTKIAHTAAQMIGGMTPTLVEGDVAFYSVTTPTELPALLPHARAIFRETEGVSLVLPMEHHPAPDTAEPMRQITLNVYSSLTGVGLTAAVATALADEGIACNMIAATHHDHAFVPAGNAQDAMAILSGLQQKYR